MSPSGTVKKRTKGRVPEGRHDGKTATAEKIREEPARVAMGQKADLQPIISIANQPAGRQPGRRKHRPEPELLFERKQGGKGRRRHHGRHDCVHANRCQCGGRRDGCAARE